MTQQSMNRRGVMKSALGAAGAAAAISVVGGAAAAAHAPRGGFDEEFPEVPGMTGDRRANEFWHVYDNTFYFYPTEELRQAVGAVVAPLGGFTNVWHAWMKTRTEGRYPHGFRELVEPNLDALRLLSREQKAIYHRFYDGRPAELVRAFQEFGQGTLYDPRDPVGDKIHMMNYTPPDPTHSYHRWQPFLRAFSLCGVDSAWWDRINKLAGMAWELQSIARPAIDVDDNPYLPRRTVQHVTRKWLARSQAEVDLAFESFPYPADMAA